MIDSELDEELVERGWQVFDLHETHFKGRRDLESRNDRIGPIRGELRRIERRCEGCLRIEATDCQCCIECERKMMKDG